MIGNINKGDLETQIFSNKKNVLLATGVNAFEIYNALPAKVLDIELIFVLAPSLRPFTRNLSLLKMKQISLVKSIVTLARKNTRVIIVNNLAKLLPLRQIDKAILHTY